MSVTETITITTRETHTVSIPVSVFLIYGVVCYAICITIGIFFL
jgi:hypothetical protein